ncbi:O-acyltransferase like protein [Leptinotarsa decemlineata]|uniref:O-acyltransferase like protein n=1 Tax=Leptinotarsa decemlineata TaxID=7539 RepID=UPI003D306A85
MKFSLIPMNNNTNTWKIVEKSKNYKHCFRRDIVYRFRCLSNVLEDETEIQLEATKKENSLLQNFSMTAHLDSLCCHNYSRVDHLTPYDYILMVILIGYLTLVGYATKIDLGQSHEPSKMGGKFFSYFSIVNQWRNLKKPITDPEYNQMKCLQGVRTYTMALVIVGHTLTGGLLGYVTNENYVEKFYVNMSTRAIVNLLLLLVQTNFMISGWLTAKMVYNHVEKNGKVTLQFVIKKMIGRYMRLFSCLAFVICLEMSNWTKVLVAPPPIESFEMDYNACQKNWWASLLLINNIFKSSEMCNLGLWYLANDIQFYVL